MKTKTNTNSNTNTTAPSVVPNSTAAVGSGFTLGLDLGDRSHYVCVLDAAGQSRHEGSLPNSRPALRNWAQFSFLPPHYLKDRPATARSAARY